MKHFYLIIILLLFFIGKNQTQAQNKNANTTPSQTIRGKVIDVASGQPIPFATVALIDITGMGSITDEEGNFIVKNIPVGRYTLQTSSVGYESNLTREIMVTSAKEVYLEIQLKENITQLDEFVVKPKINKQQPLQNMATTGARMLSVEEASRYAGGMDDPARLVGSFAGVSPSVSNNGISIHGNAPHLLQWKLEDVEIPNPNHYADVSILGGGILSSLSSHVLGNSDFFTGAFPAEYGNAVSGVFDMRLRNGNNQKMENTFQVGTLGIDVASEGPLSKAHKSSYIFNYRYSTLGLVDKAGISDLGGAYNYQDLNFKFNMPTTKAGTFTVWGTGLIDKFNQKVEKDTLKWEYLFDNSSSNIKQEMAAVGISNRYFFKDQSSLKTTLALTYFKHYGIQDTYDKDFSSTPFLYMDRRNTNLILTSAYTKKFNARHTNKTGFTYTRMFYDMYMDMAEYIGYPLEVISKGKGDTDLISAYTMSSIGISNFLTLNAGIYTQFLTLNNNYTIEPRLGLKWDSGKKLSLAAAYGLHSRMEKMDIYFVQSPDSEDKPLNKNLDFTKSHHVMFTLGYKISDNLFFKAEPYYQYLFDIPVVDGTSESVINRQDFYVEEALVNKGKGQNIGIDFTLERYLNKGFYYMSTLSLFNSRYRGGDNKWYNTRYNRNYIWNVMGGKEWMMGRNKQNIFSINAKITLQGGERYSPLDEEATLSNPDKKAIYDETRAFSQQLSPMVITNFNVSYQINRKRVSHEFAIKLLNATNAKEFYGHSYNLQTHKIDKLTDAISIPNISYKIQF